MRAAERTLLHFAAYAALVLSLYPILAMVFHYMKQSAVSVWLAEGYLFLVSAAALIHAILIRRQYRRRPVMVNTSFFAVGILAGAGAFFLTPLPGGFMGMISALAVFGVYQAGARLFFVEYDVLTHPFVYAGICTIFAVPSAAIWLGDHDASFLWQGILFLLVSGVFAVAHNFEGIDVALQSQGAEEEQLPRGLFRHNRLLLAGFGAAVLILLLMRDVIGELLWTLVKAIIQLVGKGLYWLAGLFIGKEEEAAELPESEPELLQQTMVSKNEWLTLICTLILAGIVIFLIIRYRHQIVTGIRNLVHALRTWIQRVFGHSYDAPRRMESEGYTDYHMDLTGENAQWSENVRPKRTNYSRLYRKYRRMEHGAEKYRLGYGLLLHRLESSGAAVRPSSSPREILDNLPEQELRNSLWETVTEGYEQVRYGECVPQTETFSALDMLLSESWGKDKR